MHRFGALLLVAFMLASLGLTAPLSRAGGSATVYLDEPPVNVIAGEASRFGFMVMQHDVTPVNVDGVYLSAVQRETGEAIRADARQEGVEGHYVVEVTFPSAGSWKWSITPGWFPPTSFASLDVLSSPTVSSGDEEAASYPAGVYSGDCLTQSSLAYALSDVVVDPVQSAGQPLPKAASPGEKAGGSVMISETTIEGTLAGVTAAPHAIVIRDEATEPSLVVACGEIGTQEWNGELVVGVHALDSSGVSGIALLREETGRVAVTLYLLSAARAPLTSPAEGPEVAVEIAGIFSPGRIEITAGTTVVWTNLDAISHTVQSDDLAFDDSGPLRTGESYRQTFSTPGTFAYYCGPHPGMTGTIVVT